jgi:predicted nucleotidyltransferase
MRSEEEVLQDLKDVDNGTLSGSTEELVKWELRKELREIREANPTLPLSLT